jgi:hypothetical protein
VRFSVLAPMLFAMVVGGIVFALFLPLLSVIQNLQH